MSKMNQMKNMLNNYTETKHTKPKPKVIPRKHIRPKQSQKPKFKTYKTKSNKSTVNENKGDEPSVKDLQWNLTLSVDSVAQLNALKEMYNANARNDVFKLLRNHSINDLIKNKGPQGKEDFDLFRRAYNRHTKTPALKRWKYIHRS